MEGVVGGEAYVTRAQLEHVIRAAATIADDDEIVVAGSPSVLRRALRHLADVKSATSLP